MNKPVLPTIAAYFLLLTTTTLATALYSMRAAQNPLLLWLAAFGAIYLVLGIALIRGWAWTKYLFFLWVAIHLAIILLIPGGPMAARLLCLAIFAIPATMIAMSLSRLLQPRNTNEDLGWHTIGQAIGLCFYWFAAYKMSEILFALFTDRLPAVTTNQEMSGNMGLMVGLVFMLLGGAIIGRFTIAAREAALVLIALASHTLVGCLGGFLSLRLLYPDSPRQFLWDHTFIWVAILGMSGFALMAISERRKVAR